MWYNGYYIEREFVNSENFFVYHIKEFKDNNKLVYIKTYLTSELACKQFITKRINNRKKGE